MGGPPEGKLMPIPPEPRGDASQEINHHIPWIPRGVPHQMRSDHFEENGPKYRVERDLAPGRRFVHVPQPKPALHQEQHRQSARNQQHIVEMKPQKRIVSMRLDAPAIQCVERAGDQEETITQIPKFLHRSARITKPNAAATASFRIRIIPYSAPLSATVPEVF